MSLVRHTDPDAFLAAAAPAFGRNPAAASLLRSFALGVKRRPPGDEERLYLATWSGAGGHAVAVLRGEHALFVEASEAAPAAVFADDLAKEHPTLQGVSGALDACESFARRWQQRTTRAMVMRAHLRHHMLTDVAPVPAAPGRMRTADDADADWLLDASLVFVAEAGMPDTPAQVRRNVPVVLAQRRYRIWEDDGIAAFAGWSDAGDGDARIGPVYTPAERRGARLCDGAGRGAGERDQGQRRTPRVPDHRRRESDLQRDLRVPASASGR